MKSYNKHVLKYVLIFIAALIVVELTALVILRIQTSRYADYWQNRTDSSANQTGLTYMALGDSTAQGVGATSPVRGYVGLIANALKEKTGQNIRVVNLSQTGATVNDALNEQLPKLEQHRPDVVTIEIGANDMSNFNEQEFRMDMGALIKALPGHAVISDVPYFGGGIKRGNEKNVVAANKIIHDLAPKHGLVVAPLYETTKTNDSLFRYSPDFFHPSNYGYKNWFNAFWQVLGERVY